MKMRYLPVLAATLTSLIAVTAQATTTTVVVNPGDPMWSNPSSENGAGGLGSATITGTEARDGTGSLELKGDRSRELTPNANYGALSSFAGASFDYKIAGDSTNPTYSPMFRVQIYDADAAAGHQFTDLVYEAAYNHANGNYDLFLSGAWVTTDLSALLWQQVQGVGPNETGPGGSLITQTFDDWKSTYSASAIVYAFQIGQGSGASANYHAFADDFTVYDVNGNSTVYNFEPAADVPEPAMLGLFGLGALGLAAARRRKA